jgi:hypothetical protein
VAVGAEGEVVAELDGCVGSVVVAVGGGGPNPDEKIGSEDPVRRDAAVATGYAVDMIQHSHQLV